MLEIEQTFRSATPVLNTAPFGDLLRGLRRSAALSQEELAERAGLSPRGISDLERGVRRAPHLSTVRLLAAALALNAVDQQSLIAAARPARYADVSSAPVPEPLAAQVGRESQVASLSSLLARVAELLVMPTDPTGPGTTSLAFALAAELSNEFGNGVVFVTLATIPVTAFVAPADLPSSRLRRAAPTRRWPPRCGSSPACSAASTGGS